MLFHSRHVQGGIAAPERIGVIVVIKIYKTVNRIIKEINSLEEKNLWIDLVNPTEDELLEISSKFEIDIDFLKAPLDYEERPRIEAYDGQVLIIISMPNVPNEELSVPVIYNTLPLGIVVTEKTIITVSLEKSMLIEEILKAKSTPNTQKRTRFVLQLLYNNARLFFALSEGYRQKINGNRAAYS